MLTYDITAEYLHKSNARPIHAGDDYDYTFIVENPPGTPLDLTGAEIWFTIKERVTDPDSKAKLQYNTPTDIELSDPAAGEFVIHLSADTTKDLYGTWYYDVKCKLLSGRIIRIVYGKFEFLPNITRAS